MDGVTLICAFQEAKLILPDDLSPRLKEAFQLWPDILTMELLTKPELNLSVLLIAEANSLPQTGNQSLFINYRIPEDIH
jgi:hypothetical protein